MIWRLLKPARRKSRCFPQGVVDAVLSGKHATLMSGHPIAPSGAEGRDRIWRSLPRSMEGHLRKLWALPLPPTVGQAPRRTKRDANLRHRWALT